MINLYSCFLQQSDRATAFRHQLTASAVPVLVSFPNRFLQSGSNGLIPPNVQSSSLLNNNSSSALSNRQRFLIPSQEFLADFRADVLAMAKSFEPFYSQTSFNLRSNTDVPTTPPTIIPSPIRSPDTTPISIKPQSTQYCTTHSPMSKSTS